MSVIIRLQGLPWTASAMNIRHFFTGLNIPAGGVHIIGGEGGDAFIAFSSDEDARVAMKMNMSPLNGMPVQLFLSSKSEMQSVIEAARSGGPNTAAAATAQPTQQTATTAATSGNNMNMHGGMGQSNMTPGMNNMGMQQQSYPTGNAGMPNQQNNIAGYPGMMQGQGQGMQQPNQMMGQKGGNFPMMSQQQQQFQYSQGDSVNATMGDASYAGAMGSNMGNQWPGYSDMRGTGQGENQNMNMNNMNFQHQQNQNMIGGYDNDQYSRFQNMQQQKPQQQQSDPPSKDGTYPGAKDTASGMQGRGQDMMIGGRKADISRGQSGGMMGMGLDQNRFGDNAGSGMGVDSQGQYPGMKDSSMTMNQGFMSGGSREGSRSKDNDSMTAIPGKSGRGISSERGVSDAGYSKDKYGADPLGGGPPARISRWGAEKKPEDNFSDQSQFYPDMRNRDDSFGHGMGRDEGRKWPNRFAEEGQDSMERYGRMGMNQSSAMPGFPERDSRIQGQFSRDYQNRREQFSGRFPPDRALGRMGMGSDKGSVKDESTDDGMPSTRYPPDDDEPMMDIESATSSSLGGKLDEPRQTPGGRSMPPESLKDHNQRSTPEMRNDAAMPSERRPRQRVSRFDRDDKGTSVDQEKPIPSADDRRFPPGNQSRFPPGDRYGEFPGDNRFPPDGLFPEGDTRGMGGDDRKFPGIDRPENRMGRPMPEDRYGRPLEDRDRMGRSFPGDRMGRLPEDRMGRHDMAGDRDRPGRPNHDDRLGRGMLDEFGRPMSEDRDRSGRLMSEDRDRMGRPMPEDRMWPEDRMQSEDMMRRRPGNNVFSPDDPRYFEREEELRREAFDFERGGPRVGPDDRFMRGRGPMRGMGRPGGDRYGMRSSFPPDWRERDGGMRGEDDGRYPYGPDDRFAGGPDNWDRMNRGPDGPPRPGLLETPDSMGLPKNRGPDNSEEGDGNGPFDMDQRFDRTGGGRWPGGMQREGKGEFNYGRGGPPPMEEEYGSGRGGPPRDFDSRADGPRGRGGPMMDRGPRGRGEPFGRGRGGIPPFGRGRGGGGDQSFDDHDPIGQDVDNRRMDSQFPKLPNQPPVPNVSGRGLLGDAPAISPKPAVSAAAPAGEDSNAKKDGLKDGADRKDKDNRPSPRRSDSRDRGRDRDRERDRRHYDDRRRGRDRDDRDRYGHRDQFGRDMDRRDRDRRRSRSRSRDRSDRDRDSSRYRLDNREKSDRDKPKADSGTSKTNVNTRSTRFLHIKEMPKTLSYRDLRRFFHPMEIPFDGLKILNDKEGNRTGEAFVYFHRLDDATKGQKKSGERVEGNTVTIAFTTEDNFNKAVDSFVPKKPDIPDTTAKSTTPKPASTPAADKPEPVKKPSSGKQRYIVHMKNLPLTITRQDISSFFKNLKIDNNGEAAYIEFDQSGKATGMGFVEFTTDTDYKKALTQNGSMLDKNKVSVSPGNEADCDKLKSVQGEMFQRAALRSIASKIGISNTGAKPNLPSGEGQQSSNAQKPPTSSAQSPSGGSKPPVPPSPDKNTNDSSICVHIQGLPLLATHHDIREFFSECNIAPRGINIAHDGNGKPLGEGFVEFVMKTDVDKALKKDKTSLGRHIVAVKPIGKKEMVDRLEGAKHRGGIPPKPPTSMSQDPPLNAPQIPNMSFTRPPPNSQSPKPMQPNQPQQQQQRLQTPQQQQPPQQPPHQLLQQLQQPPPSGPQDAKGLMGSGPGSGPQLRPAPPQDGSMQHKQQQQPPQQQQQHPLLQTPGGSGGPPLVLAPGGGKSFPPGVLNSNWFYVRCQNFPPDISIGEIMQFFHGFRPIGESIRLHYSSEGHPTGNAVVGFGIAEDANRALQRLHMTFCRRNPVSLHPA